MSNEVKEEKYTVNKNRGADMRKFLWQEIVLGVCLILLQIQPAFPAGTTEYTYQETKDLVALVDAAAAAIRQQGETVFADFRKEGSRWYKGDHYIFVWDMEGNRYVYPPDIEHEKGNMLNLKDVGGKPIGRMIVEAAQNKKGWGWVHYQWNKPHELEPRWKSTYIVKAAAPSGNEYLVGSGIYQSRMEKAFIIEEVEAAAALLQKEGRGTFAVLRDPTSRFYFHDTYVFVITKNGVELVNPAFPGLEGRNIWDMKDVKGNFLVQELIKQALEYENGWITYYWPKPDAPQEPVEKLSFVKKVTVDGQIMVVGAGMYE